MSLIRFFCLFFLKLLFYGAKYGCNITEQQISLFHNSKQDFIIFYLCLDHGLDVPVGKFCCIWA